MKKTRKELAMELGIELKKSHTVAQLTTMLEEKQKAEKQTTRKRTARTSDELEAEVKAICTTEMLDKLVFEHNSKGNALHVKMGKQRVFGYSAKVLVVNRKEYLVGLDFEEKKYGCRVDATEENILTLLVNAEAVALKKAEEKKAEKKDK